MSHQPSQQNVKATIYKASSRFDLTAMFVVTFACAGLVGSLQALGAPPTVQALVAGGLLTVAVVQMFVSDTWARLAGIACGWVIAGVISAIHAAMTWSSFENYLCFITVLGAMFGYIASVLVAGVFLLAAYARKALQNIFDGNPTNKR